MIDETGSLDIRTIQLLRGHASIVSTVRYLQVTRKKLDTTESPLDLLDVPNGRVGHPITAVFAIAEA